ncbi:MAG TPA: selenocysteine-specific translation elongation factor [Anaerolineaceae bacterium]|nr:selenocysteine-specific translation elongation factor [Anaerolineaceae bacterium]
MWVIGTAGHVDHGKSTLVEALTGIHPDRLKEEQEREMTIELGFAWLTLPGGDEVGIVDVPGHRDFIENMLAGVGGIDAALFVVAADEGVMPQTREHLAILNILQIPAGIIALTKTDLAPDPDWLDLVETDVRDAVAGTVLADAPLVRVSARTGAGLDDLLKTIQACLSQRPIRPDMGRPRLPIDRVFTVAGFGTVVTGTLTDGTLRVGEELEILPAGFRARIRGLQTHKRKVDTAVPGSRVAVNLTGVEVDQIRRGDILAHAGQFRPTARVDVQFRLDAGVTAPLKHNSEVKLFLGAAEVLARTRVLGAEEIRPGTEGWLQLELREPVVAVRGDRYILRRPSPGETLGGGAVIDPHPKKRHKRFAADVLERMAALSQGTPADVLAQAAEQAGFASLQEAAERAHLPADHVEPAAAELVAAGRLVALEDGPLTVGSGILVAARSQWERLSDVAAAEVRSYHQAYPLRRGMPREALKSRLKVTPRVFQAALRRWLQAGRLAENGTNVHLPEHRVRFSPQQQAAVDRLLERFDQAPYAPPSVKEAQAAVSEEVYTVLIERGDLVQVSPDVVFRQAVFDRLVEAVREHLQNHETLSVVEFRDRFETSRKYALAFLEYLDQIGVTVRVEDARKLRNPSSNR